MSVRTVKIGDLALDEPGAFKIGPFGSSLKKSELVDIGIPVVGIENVLPNQFEKGFRRFVAPTKFKELSDYQIVPDDVLVTTMGTIGRAAVVPQKLGKAIFDSHLFRMRVDTGRVLPSYLCYAINSSVVELQLQQMARGAIMQGLNTTILRECDIPLPNLPEQKRIAGQLEQADRLRRTCRYALELSDTFLPAAFLETFGNPKRNEKGWNLVPWGNLISIFSGHGFKLAEYAASGVRLLQIANVTFGEIDWRVTAFLPDTYLDSYPKLVLGPGDLVMALNRPILGRKVKFAVLQEDDCPAILYQRVGKFILNSEEIIQPFLCGFMLTDFFLHELKRRLAGSDQPYINPSELDSVRVPLPPLANQRKFAGLLERHACLRASEREALRQADHLVQCLLHRAFS